MESDVRVDGLTCATVTIYSEGYGASRRSILDIRAAATAVSDQLLQTIASHATR